MSEHGPLHADFDSGDAFNPDGSIHVHEYVEERDGLLGSGEHAEPAYVATCRTCGLATGRYAPRLPDHMVAERKS